MPLWRLTYHRVSQQGEQQQQQQQGGRGCRYDVVLVARRECFDEVFTTLQSVCTSVPRIFDTVDLHYMREAKSKRFKKAHAGNAALLEAVFGKNNLAARPTEVSQWKMNDVVRVDES